MPAQKQIFFPPYRLDPANECVWLGADAIALNRKSYAVLQYLLQNPGRLVTKDELLDALWADTHVGEGVLKVAVAEIRKALNDVSRAPLYIETLHRRGYRFVGEIQEPERGVTSSGSRTVEREADLARMESWMASALEGERQIVFITGETGIGKTTLVETLVERATAGEALWVAHGQCLEHFGEGEPYLPLLEAITRLCRQPGRESMVDLLRLHAPTWLAQMPSLIGEGERERLRREILGTGKERMLREITEAIEALTAATPLLLVLEDLHWCDFSTVDLIGYLARRKGQARLMLVGTYRPAEVAAKRHPLGNLKRGLQVRHECSEVAIEFLSEAGVARYLALRFPGSEFPVGLARLIHQRTDGNPLFMINTVDYLVARGQLARQRAGEGTAERWTLSVRLNEVEIGIPDSLLQMIEQHFERLSEEEQNMLSAASVAGMEFSTRTLAGATGAGAFEIGDLCRELVRRREFLKPAAMIQLHDGSVLERYGFIHGLYQRALYVRLPQHRRVLLHRGLGDFQEISYKQHLPEISAELAVHFEEGRNYGKAIHYRRLSAKNSARRYANREAIEHLERALGMLPHLAAEDSFELEAAILEERAEARRAMDDYGGAATDLERVAQCASDAGRTEQHVRALLKLSSMLFWTDHKRTLKAARRAVELSRELADPWLHKQARGDYARHRIRLLGWSDEAFQDCVAAMESARSAGDRKSLGWHVMAYSFFQSFRSEGREACRAADEGLEIARDTADAYLYISCQYFKAWALLHLGEWGKALEITGEGIRISEENGQETAETVLHMIEARLHLEAMDFAGARAVAERTLPRARPGFPRFLTLIALGEAHLGLGDYRASEKCLDEVVRDSEQGPFRLDWIFHLPLQRARSELRLAMGDPQRARAEAERLCELAALPGERGYLGRGRELLARIARAAGAAAEEEAQYALATAALENAEVPLAEWRVGESAATFAERRGDSGKAAKWRRRSTAALQRIAGSLDEKHPLRRLLESHARQALSAASSSE